MTNATSRLTSHGSGADNAKLIGLEVLRFLSAVAVLVWHYQHFWYAGAQAVDFERSAQPLYPLLRLFYEWGVYGVQVFWMISGFIFFWKYLDVLHAQRLDGWRFFVFRFSRLYPLHLVTFLLVAVLQLAHQRLTGHYQVYQANDGYHALLQLFMASNWGLQQADSFNGPIWSVSLEVLAYLAFFVFARQVGTRWWATLAVAGVAAVAYQARLGHVFQCIFCFFLGGLVAQAMRAPRYRQHQRTAEGLALAYVVGAALLFKLSGAFERKLVVHLYITTATPLLILVLAGRAWLSGRAFRLAAVAGNTTYSSYLLHFPLQLVLMVAAASAGWQLPRESAWFLLAYLAASVALGALVYRVFELPAQRWLRQAMAGRRAVLAG